MSPFLIYERHLKFPALSERLYFGHQDQRSELHTSNRLFQKCPPWLPMSKARLG